MGKIFIWMIANINKTIAIFTALVTVVAMPLWQSGFSFVMQSEEASAMVRVHDQKIIALESVMYRIDGRLEEILKANERIEKISYDAIAQAKLITKEVKQLNHAEK